MAGRVSMCGPGRRSTTVGGNLLDAIDPLEAIVMVIIKQKRKKMNKVNASQNSGRPFTFVSNAEHWQILLLETADVDGVRHESRSLHLSTEPRAIDTYAKG